MVDVETVKLDDGKTYMIIRENETYVYLANVDNPKDFCIRKKIKENGENYLGPIDDYEEFKKALELFQK